MIGVLVVTHGRLGEVLIETTRGIVGDCHNIRSLSIAAHESSDSVRNAIADALRVLDSGRGVLILTDMFGGTPSNISLSFLAPGKVEVLTGVNLPMLIKLATTARDAGTLSDVARLIQEYGQKNISLASALLQSRRKPGETA